jgi:putative N6-adenine-specific DNA methylase
VRELYDKAVTIDWENLIDVDGYFTVSSVVHNFSVRDTRLPSLVLKDAVVDKIRSKLGRRPDSGGDYDRGASVFLHWNDDTAIIYLDTSGAPLSKRGYRKIPGSAPMQETLAAACIDAMGWDGTSPFISPMCGSGTPAIEAAMKAMNRAPGSLRARFGFMGIKGYNQIIPGEKAPLAAPRQRFGVSPETIFKDMVLEAAQNEKKDIPPILATDISPEAIQNAHINAHAAGVFNKITFAACDFAETDVQQFSRKSGSADSVEKGSRPAIFFNPEYGIRLGDTDELKALYDSLTASTSAVKASVVIGEPRQNKGATHSTIQVKTENNMKIYTK